MEKSFWQTEQGARVLVDHLHDGIFVIEEGLFVYVNPRLADMLDYSVVELVGLPFIEVIAAEEQSLAWEMHRARLAGEKVPEQFDIHLVNDKGSLIFCSINISLFNTVEGKTVIIGTVHDVTKQKAELAEVESSKIELKSIFDELPDVFYRTNMQGIITMISPSCFDILGYRQDEMLGKKMADFYNTPEERQKVVQAIIDGGGKATRVEAALRHKNGSVVWISTNAFVRLDSNHQPASVDGVARDISERKLMEDQLTALSRIDGLTKVYTRRYFLDKSEAVLEMMKRYQRPASMMMMDLDHFKKINDNYGHQAGDLALLAFTQVCRNEIRESDVLGRLGGEEFGLILPETNIQNAQILAERIRSATGGISIPFGGQNIRLTVSIGLVEIRQEDISMDSIMHRADLAMYQAKERGRDQVVTVF